MTLSGAFPPVSSSRSLVENAVQSCLLIPNLATKDAVEAQLLRAKTRLASGYTLGAHRGSSLSLSPLSGRSHIPSFFEHVAIPIDIEAALILDPENADAKSLMLSLVPHALAVRIPWFRSMGDY